MGPEIFRPPPNTRRPREYFATKDAAAFSFFAAIQSKRSGEGGFLQMLEVVRDIKGGVSFNTLAFFAERERERERERCLQQRRKEGGTPIKKREKGKIVVGGGAKNAFGAAFPPLSTFPALNRRAAKRGQVPPPPLPSPPFPPFSPLKHGPPFFLRGMHGRKWSVMPL